MSSSTTELVRLTLEASPAPLAYELAADLESRGLGPVEVRPPSEGQAGVGHGPGTPPALVARLLEALRPIAFESVAADESLGVGEFVVRIGEPPRVSVDLRADSSALLERAAALVEQLGFRIGERHLEVQDVCRLHHTGGPALTRQLLRWALSRRGLSMDEQDHATPSSPPESRERVELRLRDPAMAGKPFGDRFAVQISTDDLAAGDELAARLRTDGFASCSVALFDEEEEDPRFRLHPGPFSTARAPAELNKLRQAIEALISSRGLDVTRFPLVTTRNDQGMSARIDLPIAHHRRPGARPYAGPYPDRFEVTIHTDDVPAAAPLRQALTKAGFAHVEVKPAASILDDPHGDQPAGLVVRWASAAREKPVAAALKSCLEEAMKQLGGALPVEAIEQPGNGTTVAVHFPVKGVADGRLAAYLADPRRYQVRLAGSEGGDWGDLKAELESQGFSVQDAPETGLRPRGRIEFGAAPAGVIERVQKLVTAMSGAAFPAKRVTGGDELLINVTLPRRVRKPAAAVANTPDPVIDLASWLGELESSPPRAFVEASAHDVRVGQVRLPRRGATGPMVPPAANFGHFCLDDVTAATLEHLAAGVLLREPCLLEGETSTSKTTAVLYLASLLRQPVVRINLNGQTDTGELVGRYVPAAVAAEDDDQGGEWADGYNHSVPKQGTPSGPAAAVNWRWQDGLIVQAMKSGWWVLLDEVNLAEPQILERLNSVLEVEPTLLLTEFDNSPVEPIHECFRAFATMNPAEYAGRSLLSPAYRDRWRGYRYVPRPGEGEYLAMLRLLVHGEQPAVMVLGRKYARGDAAAPFASLAVVLPDEILVGLARFQTSLEHAAGRSGETPRLGVRRKERHVFTRRGMLSVLDFLASPLGPTSGGGARAVRAALARYYLGRVADPHDQALVLQLLEAAGLGPRGAAGAATAKK